MDTQHGRVPPLPGHGGWMGRLGLQHPVLGQGGTWPLSAFIGSKYGTTAKDQETGQHLQHHQGRTLLAVPILDPVRGKSRITPLAVEKTSQNYEANYVHLF